VKVKLYNKETTCDIPLINDIQEISGPIEGHYTDCNNITFENIIYLWLDDVGIGRYGILGGKYVFGVDYKPECIKCIGELVDES